jgi:hypothetical protein
MAANLLQVLQSSNARIIRGVCSTPFSAYSFLARMRPVNAGSSNEEEVSISFLDPSRIYGREDIDPELNQSDAFAPLHPLTQEDHINKTCGVGSNLTTQTNPISGWLSLMPLTAMFNHNRPGDFPVLDLTQY